jgi:hypothetical protein
MCAQCALFEAATQNDDCVVVSRIAASDPIARSPDEQDKGDSQADHDEHPVLDFETQKGEMLD